MSKGTQVSSKERKRPCRYFWTVSFQYLAVIIFFSLPSMYCSTMRQNLLTIKVKLTVFLIPIDTCSVYKFAVKKIWHTAQIKFTQQ